MSVSRASCLAAVDSPPPHHTTPTHLRHRHRRPLPPPLPAACSAVQDVLTACTAGCCTSLNSGVALELQQDARAGTLSLDGDVCHIVRDTIVPDPVLAAAQREGVALRSPMYCDTRRDLNDNPGYDCFGQPLMSAAGDKSTENVMCPNCGQKTGAARFAPHLQRCMGGGRNATATRRSTTPVCKPHSHRYMYCSFPSQVHRTKIVPDLPMVCPERQQRPQFHRAT